VSKREETAYRAGRAQIQSRLALIDPLGNHGDNSCGGQWRAAQWVNGEYPTNDSDARIVLAQSLGVLKDIMGSGIWLIKEPLADVTMTPPLPPQEKASELLALKPTFMSMSVDLNELLRRAKAWWKRKK
jgi:hypothetical protein